MYLETKGLSIEETARVYDRKWEPQVRSSGREEEDVECKEKVEDIQLEDSEKS